MVDDDFDKMAESIDGVCIVLKKKKMWWKTHIPVATAAVPLQWKWYFYGYVMYLYLFVLAGIYMLYFYPLHRDPYYGIAINIATLGRFHILPL